MSSAVIVGQAPAWSTYPTCIYNTDWGPVSIKCNTKTTGAMKAVAAFQEAQTKGKAIVLITDEVHAGVWT